MALYRLRHSLCMVLLLGCLLALGAGAALAATYTVTNASDSGPGSLRDAIASAASGDTIQFDAGMGGEIIMLGSTIDAGAKNLSFSAASGTVAFIGPTATLQGSGTLTITGSNHFNFINALNFTGGLTAPAGSSANISLADYSGGRITLGTGNYAAERYLGGFSGKLNLQNFQYNNVPISGYGGGGLLIYNQSARYDSVAGNPVNILAGSIVSNNSMIESGTNGAGLYVRGDIGILDGTFANNSISYSSSGASGAGIRGGAVYSNTGAIGQADGTFTNNTLLFTGTGAGDASSAGGAISAYYSINLLSGTFTSNSATSVSASGMARVYGGAVNASNGFINVTGSVTDSRAEARSASGEPYAAGGGLYTYEYLTDFSGLLARNQAIAAATGGSGTVEALGGGGYIRYGLRGGTLGGVIEDNSATASSAGSGAVEAQGGGLYSDSQYSGYMRNFTGTVRNNSATATSTGTGNALAQGGGIRALGFATTLSGTVTGNTATASVAGASATATALGGGISTAIYGTNGDIITKGLYDSNRAIASGANTRAEGGAIFIDTYWGYTDNQRQLTLDPKDGTITFSNNSVSNKGVVTPNDIHFGLRDPGNASRKTYADTTLAIKDSLATGNLVTIGGGLTTSLNNGKAFIMTQDAGSYFNWGGVNVFDAGGGSAVTLSGATQFISGFSLDRGTKNGNAGNVVMNLDGGGNYYQVAGPGDTGALTESFSFANTTLNLTNNSRLVPYGTLILGDNTILNAAAGSGLDLENGAAMRASGSSQINGAALVIDAGKTLAVDLGKTLTLGAGSTLAVNGGILSFGVGAGNTSGLIDMTAAASAPTFSGSNTLDIATWISGTYTVLKAGTAMGESASGVFSAFTMGGNTLGAGMTLTPAFDNMGKDLLITAALSRDNAELAWGGAASGAWNYTDANWTLGGASANFLPKDAALLNGMGGNSHTITLGGTSISLSGLHATELDNYTLSGAALHIDSGGAQGAAVPALSYAGKLVKEGGGVLALNTGGAANPNRINTVELKNGNLKFGDGFALAPVSGRGAFTQTGGMLMLAGAVSISNYDLLLPGAFYMAPNTTLTLADSTLDKSSVALSMDEATLVSAGSYNTLNNTGLEIKNGGGLEMRGNSVLTVANLPFSIISLAGGTATWRAGDNQLRLGGGGSLGLGVLDVDLNRSQTLAAIEVTGGSLALQESTLRLRHTGGAATDGSWLIINGAYTDYNGATNSGESFQTLDIATATLAGTLRNDPTQVWFDGSYTPLTPDGVAGLDRLPPNARAAAAGLLERVENGRGPVYDHLYSLSGEAFTNAVLGILPYASAEGAVSQGIQALSGHHAAAMAAFGYAFGNEALESAQGFAPLAFQAPNTLGFNIGSQNRRDQARLTGRYADRMASLDGNFGYGHSVYSVLGNWRPATDETRGLVAQASPEYALNAAANPNTPFGARIWGGYLGNFAHQDKKGGYAGYDSDQNGFLIGGSFDLNPNWTLGAYAGWTTGETRYSGIRTRVDTDATHVGAFARYRREAGPGTVKVTGDILYSYTDNDSRRTVPTAIGDQRMKGGFDQNIWGGGLELAYDWRPESDPATVLTPYVAARYAHLDQDGFSESGDLGLKVDGTDADSFTTTLGFKAARDFAVGEALILTPKATVGWLHQWADRDIAANSNFIGSPVTFMTRSVKQDTDAALLGAGLDVLIKTGKSWDLGLKLGYGADIRRNSNDQTVFAGFEIRF